ncbi:hypothetical protein SC1083_0732 [Aggregatibacter actinomycetemcomitans serotype e str. SC1083]|uniref:Uncharacterized protein n=1 Tax=Aggregatibacter actinomycetemcomitans serotype e str. SC1083 TaxID=907488 RepID=G4A7D6_AGGAC|nr:hypothetical protein SC1083_0732 [Aggregatibacter actinomycetemcomitans serotype e str. SC1083]
MIEITGLIEFINIFKTKCGRFSQRFYLKNTKKIDRSLNAKS